jgi:hypothetical protein
VLALWSREAPLVVLEAMARAQCMKQVVVRVKDHPFQSQTRLKVAEARATGRVGGPDGNLNGNQLPQSAF